MKNIIVSVFAVLAALLGMCQSLPAMTFAEIMAPEFGQAKDAISIYDELTSKTGGNKSEELRLARDWRDLLVKKLDGASLPQEQLTRIGKELLSVCMVGMFYANKYFFMDKKSFNKYAEIFMPTLYYSTYLLGATGEKLTNADEKAINSEIYMPLLKELAVHDKKAAK